MKWELIKQSDANRVVRTEFWEQDGDPWFKESLIVIFVKTGRMDKHLKVMLACWEWFLLFLWYWLFVFQTSHCINNLQYFCQILKKMLFDIIIMFFKIWFAHFSVLSRRYFICAYESQSWMNQFQCGLFTINVFIFWDPCDFFVFRFWQLKKKDIFLSFTFQLFYRFAWNSRQNLQLSMA